MGQILCKLSVQTNLFHLDAHYCSNDPADHYFNFSPPPTFLPPKNNIALRESCRDKLHGELESVLSNKNADIKMLRNEIKTLRGKLASCQAKYDLLVSGKETEEDKKNKRTVDDILAEADEILLATGVILSEQELSETEHADQPEDGESGESSAPEQEDEEEDDHGAGGERL